jgi:hypothetical protein
LNLDRLPTLNDPDQNCGDGENQQDVKESTQRIGRCHSQKPHHQQNHEDCPKHGCSFHSIPKVKLQSRGQTVKSLGQTRFVASKASYHPRLRRLL